MPTRFNLLGLIQSLPQELIDAIFTLVFTLSKNQVEISRGYLPPSLLQINRSTRESFAAEYYAHTIFHGGSDKLLIKWLLSLPSQHVNLLKRVRFFRRVRKGKVGEEEDEVKVAEVFRYNTVERLRAAGVEVESGRFLSVWSR